MSAVDWTESDSFESACDTQYRTTYIAAISEDSLVSQNKNAGIKTTDITNGAITSADFQPKVAPDVIA